MALLLAGLPESVPGVTVNRLCASGLSAVVEACRAVGAGEGDLFVAGGVESMTPRAARDDEGRQAVGARQRRRLRHAARLALPEPAAGGAVPARVDGRDGRERRRALGRLARGPGRVRARARSSAGPPRRRRAASPTSSSRSASVDRRRASAARTRALEKLAALEPAFRDGRHGDGRERERRQRRRRRARGRVRGEGPRARRRAARRVRRQRRGRRRPARDGHRADARRCGSCSTAPALTRRRPRPRRAQRGVRLAVARRHAASSASTRRR